MKKMRIPDNYDIWLASQERQERRFEKLPECAWCGNKIQTVEAYRIDDKLVCTDCIDDCKVYLEEDD